MILSRRERYVAIVAGSAAALFVLYQYLFNPFWERRVQAQDDVQSLTETKLQPLVNANRRNRSIEQKWTEMNNAGLRQTANAAMGKLQRDILGWAQEAHLSIAQRGDRPQTERQFQRVTVRVTAQIATMQSISYFLWRVNTSKQPIRVTDLQIRPKREGSEELTMEIGISTLCLAPEKDADKAARPREERP